MELTVHDLVRIASPASIAATSAAPVWVAATLEVAPWVVVRRAAPVAGVVPVGVRGATRAERFAATASPSEVLERLRPEDLRDRRPHRPHRVFVALDGLVGLLDATGCAWGPGGSAAFELASGRPTLGPESDLDLILRCKGSPDRGALASLLAAAEALAIRVDIMIETTEGGVALAELLGAGDEILLRTTSGPRLVRRADLIGANASC